MATIEESRAVIEAVFREERARIIARLTRFTQDVGVAEELAHDACLAALEAWSESGIPEHPGAWLLASAKNRALDQWRRRKMAEPKHHELAALIEANGQRPSIEDTLDEDVGDDLLRLIFLACHPALSMDAQVALTLRLLCGLSTDEIARAFLAEEPTIAQRIVRAKRSLAEAHAEFALPCGEARASRTSAVLRVIYLVFNEGYAATRGESVVREELCAQALQLGRTLMSLMPVEPEVHALTALMELQAARFATRVDADGSPVLLLDQDRARWDQAAITRGLLALTRAHLLGGRGPYVLQAEIAACHARARRAEDTDWPRIAARYAELAAITPSPIIELNRAIAVSMAEGPEAGLRMLDALDHERSLARYHRVPAARGDMLFRLGRLDEARRAFERAAALASHDRDRALLHARANACAASDARG